MINSATLLIYDSDGFSFFSAAVCLDDKNPFLSFKKPSIFSNAINLLGWRKRSGTILAPKRSHPPLPPFPQGQCVSGQKGKEEEEI